MSSLLTYTINGALTGLLYALIAMSFVIIYRSARVFNFAQGELIVVGAFLIWTYMALLDLDWWVAIPIALVSSLVLGLVVERLILRPLVGEELFSFVMVTIGLLILLRGLVLVVWGPEVRFFPAILPVAAVRLGSIVIDQALLYGGLLTILLAGLTSWFFNRTQVGLEMSAVAEDHQTALSLGISVKRSIAIAWGISAMLSTLAAIIFLNGKGMTFLASDIGFAALPVALLAGLESIGGVVLGGLIVGIVSGLAAYFLDPLFDGGVASVFPFLIMVLILLIRPTGLFGWKTIERI
ncbi:MAG: branched-chain amino acid ABC transporter permease [Xanthobacteraceae bacterium]|nr:branched-chain amino acid ABC transporter permease [Xanthobacteraceae bacterium]GIK97753.1 MAG: branched-chain amino acid ABC transporter permease [Alphaproteobacteria bacterium]